MVQAACGRCAAAGRTSISDSDCTIPPSPRLKSLSPLPPPPQPYTWPSRPPFCLSLHLYKPQLARVLPVHTATIKITGSVFLFHKQNTEVYCNRACIIPSFSPGSNIYLLLEPHRDTRQPIRVVPHMTSATPKHPAIAHKHKTLMHVRAPEHFTRPVTAARPMLCRRYYVKVRKEGGI